MEEIWKDIVGYEGFYQVSNLGRVRSLDRYIEITNKRGTLYRRPIKGKLLSLNSTDDDYISVALTKDSIGIFYSVHRLVAQAFIPNPDNLPQVNHKDENPSNNCADNLEWCTAKYNCNYGTRREKLSKSLSGRIRSEEHCRRISESHSGINNPMYGRKHTAEWKQEQSRRMSEQRKGKSPWNKGKNGLQVAWNKGLHTRSITCLDAGIEFACYDDAAAWVGNVTPEAVMYAVDRIACCRGHVFAHSDNIPQDINLHIKQCILHSKNSQRYGKSCKCIEDNKVFDSINEASKYYNVSYHMIHKGILNGEEIVLKNGKMIHLEYTSIESL